MATMSNAERSALSEKMQHEMQNTGCTKPEWRAALDAVDQWVSDNAAAFNTALPAAFRTKATPSEKALLLMYVVQRRFLAGV